MGKYIGIDLGTTFSVSAVIDDEGKPKIIKDFLHDATLTPSTVYFSNDNAVAIGEDANDSCIDNPERFIEHVKFKMGTSEEVCNIDGTGYRAEEISAMILKHIKDYSSQQLGDIAGAVITVPAYFTNNAKEATKDAAKLAGLNVVGMINEPTAAALSYKYLNKDIDKQIFLVYDLGGGTFDVSLVEINGNEFTVLKTLGDHNLGGATFNNRIFQWIKEELENQGARIDLLEHREIKCKLMLDIEKAKKNVCRGISQCTIKIRLENKPYEIKFTKEQFENLIQFDLEETIDISRNVIDDANITADQVDEILLVGGSSRIPTISALLTDEFCKEPKIPVDPDLAVAIGAAYHAASFVGKIPEDADKGVTGGLCEQEIVKFKDCTSHAIGIVVQDMQTKKEYNKILIPQNTAIPAFHSEMFCTVLDNQISIIVQITEGELEDLNYTTIIGKSELKFPPKAKGAPMKVTIECDENYAIHVSVFDVNDNVDLGEMHIERRDNMNSQQMKKAAESLGKLDI